MKLHLVILTLAISQAALGAMEKAKTTSMFGWSVTVESSAGSKDYVDDEIFQLVKKNSVVAPKLNLSCGFIHTVVKLPDSGNSGPGTQEILNVECDLNGVKIEGTEVSCAHFSKGGFVLHSMSGPKNLFFTKDNVEHLKFWLSCFNAKRNFKKPPQ